MNNHLIDFEKHEWVNAGVGMKYKMFLHDNRRIRMVEFSEGFIEPDWCRKGHVGYVLDGSCELDFNGRLEHFEKGDTLYIPAGEADKHKAVLGKGQKVTLILFEILEG